MQSELNDNVLQNVQLIKRKRRSYFNWWYRFTAPPVPPPNAPLDVREVARQGRLTSIVIFILIFLNFGSVPSAVAGLNPALLIVLIVSFVTIGASIVLNRRGFVFWAGLILVLVHAIGIMINLFTTPSGLSFQVISSFAILILPTLLAAALLPASSVFVFAVLNTIFCFFAVRFMPHAKGFNDPTSLVFVQGVVLPAVVQGATAGISFLWVSSLQRALRERDQAEEVARLERDLSEQSDIMAKQKVLLDQSIDMILQTQMRVANGDLNARVPLTSENVLWPVAGSLNNLITRLQRAQGAEEQLERTKSSAGWLVSIMRNYKAGQPTGRYTRTGTVIDPIAMELFSPNKGQQPSQEQRQRI
jgi:hypothetical protein